MTSLGLSVSRSLSLSVSLLMSACSGREPDFQASSLTQSQPGLRPGRAAEPFDREANEEPDLEALREMGLGDILSEGPPPPPFWPDEAHYPPVPEGGNLEAALHGGNLNLVDVVRVEAIGGDSLVTGRAGDGEELTIVFPENYACTAPGGVAVGGRYLLITGNRDEVGRPQLYLGIGAEHSIMRVDERGMVDTHFGMRDAAELIASVGGST